MKIKNIISGAGILLGLGIVTWQMLGFNYNQFTQKFEQLLYLASIILLLILILYPTKTQPQPPHPKNGYLAFGIALTLVFLTNTIVNPLGISPINPRITYPVLGMRILKLGLYKTHPPNADILILGSSRAFPLDPAYLQQEFGASAFNFSVEGGSTVDFIVINNLSNQNPTAKPKMLLIEMVSPSAYVNVWARRTPPQLANHIPPENQWEYWNKFIETGLSVTTTGNSLYLSANPNLPSIWQLQTNGQLIAQIGNPQGFFKTSSQAGFSTIYNNMRCERLNPTGLQALKRLVEVAKKEKTAILFYQSPIHNDFFKAIEPPTPDVQECQNLFSQYMQEITQQNPNIYYSDLTRYQPITSRGLDTFIDYQHLTPYGAQLVIQTLAPQIESGLQWAQNQQP